MHIALCDDNVADRKQFERLVKRESDRRAADEGILFVDSLICVKLPAFPGLTW